MAANLHVILLHDQMNGKQPGEIITTSLTTIDMHDLARSSRTFGCKRFFVAHPSPTLRKLAHALQDHWEVGFGASYNENRKEALHYLQIVSSLDEAITKIDMEYGVLPTIISTSAHEGGARISYPKMRSEIENSNKPYLLMFGTGWGMSDALLARATHFLEPIRGAADYNHLSVRSACAIILDRLCGER